MGFYKCNSDSVAKENPGLRSTTLCVRDGKGSFIYEESTRLEVGSNIRQRL